MFLMFMNTWQFHLLNWLELSLAGHLYLLLIHLSIRTVSRDQYWEAETWEALEP